MQHEKKIIAHLLWMCENMPNRQDDPFKWNRWLGFIQGCCFSLDIAGIEELKRLNKTSLANALATLQLNLKIIAKDMDIKAERTEE